MVHYKSTRGGSDNKSFRDVVLEGLAPDGGLYLPQTIPQFRPEDWSNLKGKSYQDIAYAIMKPFIGNDIPDQDLKDIIAKSYGTHNFRHTDITPLKSFDDTFYILELFHGPTLAFKDVALQFLGQLFDYFLKQTNDTMTIIGATSGDTGSAAIESIRHCDNARIFMLHPHGRTSDIQRKQMTHVQSDNVFNIAIEGTFDDCQNIVKDCFNNPDFRQKHKLSAVNSINWARIMAQMVYYVVAALQVDAPRTPVRFAVPTGNFGNIFAAFMCKQMGLPIDVLIIGSNRNDILTRFFETGTMALQTVEPSHSPSMDIQISSNFERYLYYAFDQNANMLKQFMTDFKTSCTANVSGDLLTKSNAIFHAFRSTDEDTLSTIKEFYDQHDYICDPHTAVGVHAAFQNGLSRTTPTIALACAHPAKFPDTVVKSIGITPDQPDILNHLSKASEFFKILPADTQDVMTYMNEQA